MKSSEVTWVSFITSFPLLLIGALACWIWTGIRIGWEMANIAMGRGP